MRGGPGSLFIAYSMVGILVYYVMTCMGEMAAFLLMDKGFGGYAARFVDPALGYVLQGLVMSEMCQVLTTKQFCCRLEFCYSIWYCTGGQFDGFGNCNSVLETRYQCGCLDYCLWQRK